MHSGRRLRRRAALLLEPLRRAAGLRPGRVGGPRRLDRGHRRYPACVARGGHRLRPRDRREGRGRRVHVGRRVAVRVSPVRGRRAALRRRRAHPREPRVGTGRRARRGRLRLPSRGHGAPSTIGGRALDRRPTGPCRTETASHSSSLLTTLAPERTRGLAPAQGVRCILRRSGEIARGLVFSARGGAYLHAWVAGTSVTTPLDEKRVCSSYAPVRAEMRIDEPTLATSGVRAKRHFPAGPTEGMLGAQ